MNKTAICLLSGGLDSATALYVALKEGFIVNALTVDYGQSHKREIQSAQAIAGELGIEHEVIEVALPWKGSALLDPGVAIPAGRSAAEIGSGIPATYVPARNTVFLSLAASWAETVRASHIFFGANIQDYSGYPDCRPEYLNAMAAVFRLGTKMGQEGTPIHIETPLIKLSKKLIILLGRALGVPFEKTWSCYKGLAHPCGECDSCLIRAKGFKDARLEDPLVTYVASAY